MYPVSIMNAGFEFLCARRVFAANFGFFKSNGSPYRQHAIFSIVDRVRIFGRSLVIYVLKREPFAKKDAG